MNTRVTFGTVSRGMLSACMLPFKSTLPFASLFIFLEFQIPKGVRLKGKSFSASLKITALRLIPRKLNPPPPTFHTTNVQQKEKKKQSLTQYWAISNAVLVILWCLCTRETAK